MTPLIKVHNKCVGDRAFIRVYQGFLSYTRLPRNSVHSSPSVRINIASKASFSTLTEIDRPESKNIENKLQVELNISGVSVNFPYQPYDCQVEMMTRVIEAIQSSQNGLLESPTGWQSEEKRRAQLIKEPGSSTLPRLSKNLKVPKIYYCSRTHKQLAQIVEELRSKTAYQPKISILASRDKYCIHSHAVSSSDVDGKCAQLRKNNSPEKTSHLFEHIEDLRARAGLDVSTCFSKADNEKISSYISSVCGYYPGKGALARFVREAPPFALRELSNSTHGDSVVWGIKELKEAGKQLVGCPYYASKELAETADLILCPYNYILHPHIRKALKIDLKGSIVIIDEAHNIEKASREAVSLELEISKLEKMSQSLKALAVNLDISDVCNELKDLLDVLINLEDNFPGYVKVPEHVDVSPTITDPGPLWAYLESEGLSLNALSELSLGLTEVGLFLDSNEMSSKLPPKTEFPEFYLHLLESILDVLRLTHQVPNAYKIARLPELDDHHKYKSVKLALWCLDSGVPFTQISKDTRSIILASGTMSPLDTFSSELNVKFDHQLVGKHVISRSQIWAGVIPVGPSGCKFNGIFKVRNTQRYQDDLGLAVAKVVERVPGGVLCFVPSYNFLDQLMSNWENTKVLDLISSQKEIMIEPQGGGAEVFDGLIAKYKSNISKGQGSIIFAVFRGKLSEGLDFKDQECRCVISIGIPFPNVSDPSVIAKQTFNDSQDASRNLMSGEHWYVTDAHRAINQGLGRSIRHKDDWASIVLLESRFLSPVRQIYLSKWIKDSLVCHKTFKKGMTSLSNFFSFWQPSLSDTQKTARLDSKLTSIPKHDTPPDNQNTK